MSASATSLSIGQKVSNYEIVRPIGEGAMGEVYEVVDKTLDRRAALKLIPPVLARDKGVVARFRREARAASRVKHASVVHIYEYGVLAELGNAPYFIMEYLEGETLQMKLKRASKKPGGCMGLAALPLLRQLALALSSVHRQGLVHRDLKPANIMIVADPAQPGGERAKLLDFGIVKILNSAESPADSQDGNTRQGLVLGTPRYMAPEQWKTGGRIDGKTDVYALGVITYFALTGDLPFVAADAPELGMMHCYKPAPSIASKDPMLPAVLVELVARMLEKDGERRPTMTQVADTMARAQPRSGLFEMISLILGNSDVEISVHREPDTTQRISLDEITRDDLTAELTQPLQQIRERPTNQLPVVPLVPPRDAAQERALDNSECSLPVGSSDTWRPPTELGTWIASGAACMLLLTAVYFMVGMRGSRQMEHGAVLQSRTTSAPVSATVPASMNAQEQSVLRSTSEPLSGWRSSAKSKHKLARQAVDISCIRTPKWSIDQRQMLLRALSRTDVKLRPEEPLVLTGLTRAPELRSAPKSLSHHVRRDLLKELRRIQDLFAPGAPAEIEICCPPR